MQQAAHETLVREYFAALDGSDRAALARLFTPDILWRVPKSAVPPYGGDHHGQSDVIEMMASAASAAFVPGSARTEIGLLIADGDRAVAETRLRAMTPDGRMYDNAYVFVFEFRDGLIAQIREHVDTRYAADFFS